MSVEAGHPQASEMLQQLRRFSSSLEDQTRQTEVGSFSAADQTETVKVTIDGRRCLTGLYIEDGLLRLGAETVAQRIDEALASAQAAADAALAAQQQQLVASLTELAGWMKKMLERP